MPMPMFFIVDNRCRYFCITPNTVKKHYSTFFLQ